MKYYLVFTPDDGNSEDCNVYYSYLVIANDEAEAKKKFTQWRESALPSDPEEYEFLEMVPVEETDDILNPDL